MCVQLRALISAIETDGDTAPTLAQTRAATNVVFPSYSAHIAAILFSVEKRWVANECFLQKQHSYMIQQTAAPSVSPISLLCFYQPSLSQIIDGTASGGFGELQVFGNRGNGRPADAVFVGTVGEVNVNGDCSVGQIHPV